MTAPGPDAGRRAFTSRSIFAGRYLWDPVVHQHFREKCSYFLLRYREPQGQSILDTLQSLLAAADISSHCIYITLGYYDALIRIWATDDRRLRFLRALRASESAFEDVLEFKAEYIEYLWAGADDKRLDLETLEEFKPLVTTVVTTEADQRYTDATRQQALLTLDQEGLIHWRPPVTPPAIKGYVVLQRTDESPLSRSEELTRLRTLLLSLGDLLNVSIYVGEGFGDYLLKIVVPDYVTLTNDMGQVWNLVDELGLRPMTHLIVNSDAPESDTIDALVAEITVLESQVVQALAADLSSNIRHLPRDDRASLARIYQSFAPILVPSAFRSTFLTLLEASIRSDAATVNEKLGFLQHLESLFREYLLDIVWTSILGETWPQSVLEWIHESPSGQLHEIHAPQDRAAWSLGTLVEIAMISSQKNRVIRQRFGTDLGPRWPDDLRRAAAVRAAAARGVVFLMPRLDEFHGQWGETLRGSFQAASLYGMLVSIMAGRTPHIL